jgi:hypothetical protein
MLVLEVDHGPICLTVVSEFRQFHMFNKYMATRRALARHHKLPRWEIAIWATRIIFISPRLALAKNTLCFKCMMFVVWKWRRSEWIRGRIVLELVSVNPVTEHAAPIRIRRFSYELIFFKRNLKLTPYDKPNGIWDRSGREPEICQAQLSFDRVPRFCPCIYYVRVGIKAHSVCPGSSSQHSFRSVLLYLMKLTE